MGRSAIAKSTIPAELQEPKNAISGQKVVFEDLLGWGARTAIGTLLVFFDRRRIEVVNSGLLRVAEIYQERREYYLKDEVKGRAQQLDDQANA